MKLRCWTELYFCNDFTWKK